jgi:hypothetical protein
VPKGSPTAPAKVGPRKSALGALLQRLHPTMHWPLFGAPHGASSCARRSGPAPAVRGLINRDFLPGHDVRAVLTGVREHFGGSPPQFIRWVDETLSNSSTTG